MIISPKTRIGSLKRDCKSLWRLLINSGRLHPWWIAIASFALLAVAALSFMNLDVSHFTHEHRTFVASKDCPDCTGTEVTDTFDGEDKHGWRAVLGKTSLGAGFTFVLATVTVLGFLLSLAKMDDLLGHVTSLRSFLERSVDVLDDAIKHADNVWVICHSPFIGNLSERNKKSQIEFRNKLTEIASNSSKIKLNVVCLSPEGLRQYYQEFKKDERYADVNVPEAFAELIRFITDICDRQKNNEYYGLGYGQKPEFFLIATDYQAVIATPLRIPGEGPATDHFRKVEALGFMTRHAGTIEELLDSAKFLVEGKSARNYSVSEGEFASIVEEIATAFKPLGEVSTSGSTT